MGVRFVFTCLVCGGTVAYAKRDDAGGVYDRHRDPVECIRFLRSEIEKLRKGLDRDPGF